MTTDEMKAAATFAVGDEVEWTSQAGGHRTTKRGRVVQVVPSKSIVSSAAAQIYQAARYYDGNTWRREHSYLVLVPGAAPGFASRLYWPRTKQLRKAEAAST